MTPHPQAKWIKAKADGHAIQYQACKDPVRWGDMHDENWSFPEDMVFRIKPAAPEVEYPVTQMTPDELVDAWSSTTKTARQHPLVFMANAAIRHAIDAQQVVRMAEVQEIASQLGKDKRAARDMAVAREIVKSLQWVFQDQPSGVWQRYGEAHLKELIARVK